MAADGWTRATVEALVRAGALSIHDGYRARNVELGRPGLPFARAGTIDQGFHFEDVDCLHEEHLAKVGDAQVALLDARVWKALDERRAFEALRDTLLPRLLSGALRV
ncbi:MAG TPA: hypothetical protein VK539_06280 [Myxococcaceae bacterium]|nr:hypothetical protein [Myxococcaceae bacterium]